MQRTDFKHHHDASLLHANYHHPLGGLIIYHLAEEHRCVFLAFHPERELARKGFSPKIFNFRAGMVLLHSGRSYVRRSGTTKQTKPTRSTERVSKNKTA